jgi:hypothetical protein
MNPLSLLTKGRTLKGGKDRAGAYKLPKEGAIPVFAPTKSHTSSFAAAKEDRAVAPAKAGAPLEQKISQSTLFTQSAQQPPAHAPARDFTRAPAQAPKPVAHFPSPPGLWDRLSGPVRRWVANRKASPFQGPTVQTELALDKVLVVRNDLSEDDLEVVAIGKSKKVKSPPQRAQNDQCQTISTNQ